MTNPARPPDRRVQMLDAEPGIVSPGFVRAADLQQHKLDRQTATGYQAADIGNIGRHDVVGAIGKKPPPGAGAAQCGDGEVGVVGGEGVAEGQREKHTRNGGQRSACASSRRVRNTGSAVALKASVDERPQARADGCAGLHVGLGRLYFSIFRKFSSSSLAYSAKFSWIHRRRPRDIW